MTLTIFKTVKNVVTNHGFRIKVKAVVTNYDFNFNYKTVVTNYGFMI